MSTYQIWGSFSRDDDGREFPTTVSLFEKGQLMGDGATTMLDFERKFAAEDGEDLVLLKEFDPVPGVWLSKEAELEVARQIFDSFMDGWWQITEEDPGAKHDRRTHESEPAGTPLDV